MFSNPLGWFEVSRLPDAYFEPVPPLVKAWKAEREAILSGHIIPIGEAPDGIAWIDFASVAKDRRSARLVVFRELNNQSAWTVEMPLLDVKAPKVSVPGDGGEATHRNGRLTARIPDKLR